jgi:hypothetical protein
MVRRIETSGTAVRIIRYERTAPEPGRPRLARSRQGDPGCCGAEGADRGEAYTAIGWGVGLSHEILTPAEAETFTTVEGDMCGTGLGNRRRVRRPHSTYETSNKADHKSAAEMVEGRRPVEGKVRGNACSGLSAGLSMSPEQRAYGSVASTPTIASHFRQEPGAGKPHAGICGGGELMPQLTRHLLPKHSTSWFGA